MSAEAPKIKFCGITSLSDAERAVANGAWAIGLIFWPGSPRRCGRETATEIAAAVKRRVEVAGVFVNATLEARDARRRAGRADDAPAARR